MTGPPHYNHVLRNMPIPDMKAESRLDLMHQITPFLKAKTPPGGRTKQQVNPKMSGDNFLSTQAMDSWSNLTLTKRYPYSE